MVGFCFVTMFLFVPETFWDRAPRPKKTRKSAFPSLTSLFQHHDHGHGEKSSSAPDGNMPSSLKNLAPSNTTAAADAAPTTIAERRKQKAKHHVGFIDPDQSAQNDEDMKPSERVPSIVVNESARADGRYHEKGQGVDSQDGIAADRALSMVTSETIAESDTPRSLSPTHTSKENSNYLNHDHEERTISASPSEASKSEPTTPANSTPGLGTSPYTNHLRTQPAKTFAQTLKPWNGRLRHENWLKVALRPFILFAYPSILWSTLVYSLSIGWLIVLSESVSSVYRNKETYNFTAMQTGLVYVSPFVGGVLGTAVAGKVSDVIVRFMSRRNGGIYEPEFRLVMAAPVMISTCIGLMGFGWSAAERDNWIVPTIFFGIISFGCSLGSTTSITFAVDSYRQYAGEALVTLNFSKNIFHGLLFSLFFNRWLEADGSKDVFLAIGGIQIACLLTTVPMYIYGKRARMWTVRKNLMEKF